MGLSLCLKVNECLEGEKRSIFNVHRGYPLTQSIVSVKFVPLYVRVSLSSVFLTSSLSAGEKRYGRQTRWVGDLRHGGFVCPDEPLWSKKR